MASCDMCFLFLVTIVTLIRNAQSSKILINPGKGSHYLRATILGGELVARGHRVTILLAEDEKHKAKDPFHQKLFNYSIYNTTRPISTAKYRTDKLYTATYAGTSKLKAYWEYAVTRTQRYCKFFDETVLKRLSEERFDIVISDPSRSLPCDDGLGRYLGIPRGFIQTGSLFPAFLRQTGLMINPATTGELGYGFPSQMNFLQRVMSVMNCVVLNTYLTLYSGNSFWQGSVNRSINSVVHLADFVIMASDPLIDKVIPLPPSYITGAGLTARPPKPLEKGLEDFMLSSGEHGVIIFTIGLSAPHISEELVDAFRDAFSKVPQKVIWQWKDEKPLENAPDNVMTLDWLPQNDLLGHNKTKLFIYQGGNNGLYEAIYHGVPLIVMPMNFDQPDIAQNVVEKKIGLTISITEVTSESLSRLINEVLTDKKYRSNMAHMSDVFRDRPQTPTEEAADFVERVLKHGADDLRTQGSRMSFIQLYLFDVMGFLLVCALVVTMVAFMVRECIVRLIGTQKR